MATLTTTATVAAFFSSTAFIVTASLLAAALIAYLIYALVTGESKPAAPAATAVSEKSPVPSDELDKKQQHTVPEAVQPADNTPAGSQHDSDIVPGK